MRKDAGINGDAQRIEQLVWLLFLKVFDDHERDYEIAAQLAGNQYRSPIPAGMRWRDWASDDEGITGDNLLEFIDRKLFPTLKDLPVEDTKDKAQIVRSIFEDCNNYMKSGTLLRQVVNKINEGIDLTKRQERHLFNDIYEQILKDLQSAGNAGEFYTPRACTQFIVDMVDPKLGESVLDPACGTGGFLINTVEHIRQKGEVETVAARETLQTTIRGVEKKPLPHMLATTNLILHGIENPTIDHDNLLSYATTGWTYKDRVDVIVTNPPFGGKEEDGVERNFPASYRTRETADLFLYLIIHLLKDGGRCGMILPDGFLFGDGVTARLKERLLETCNFHTIVKLPKGVFNPYTGINTNLLFFEKGKPTKDVWYFEHPYPEGYKSYSKTKPMRIQEFELEKSWWNKREVNEFAWKVSVEEIKERNFNLDIKNPHVGEQIIHDPDELLKKYSKQEEKLGSMQAQIRNILAEALGHAGND